MKKELLIQKWLDNELSPEEEKAFRQLEEHDDFTKLAEKAKFFRAPEFSSEEHYSKLKSGLEKESSTVDGKLSERPRKTNWGAALLKIAAVAVLTLGIYYFFFPTETSVSTLAGTTEKIALPDGSEVVLNDVSTLKYNKGSWGKNRKVLLEGEAFFNVETGKTFKVVTSGGTVSVLGTEFNVKQREDYFEVTCYEGLVLVETPGKSIKLPAGKSFRIINGEMLNGNTGFGYPTWMEELSTFKSVPFEMVLAEFERQYDVEIEVKNNYLDELYTGSFTHTDIKTAIQSIALPFNLEASKKGKKISLSARE